MISAHFFFYEFLFPFWVKNPENHDWIIAKNEIQFGRILRFGPPINFTRPISRDRYNFGWPKYWILRIFRGIQSPHFDDYSNLSLSSNFYRKIKTKLVDDHMFMIIWKDSYSMSHFKIRPILQKWIKKRVFRLMLWMPSKKGVASKSRVPLVDDWTWMRSGDFKTVQLWLKL